MTDLSTAADLATAAGTLVLAVATFASIRAGRRSTELSERALRANLRPLLFPTRFTDPKEKVSWGDQHVAVVPGGLGTAEVTEEAIYLAMSLRNVGSGMAVLDRWCLRGEDHRADDVPAPMEEYRRLSRDLYVPPNDQSFWQGTLRDPNEDLFAQIRDQIKNRQAIIVEVLYGDMEGGQRTITRFAFMPRNDDEWMISLSRHWFLDNDDPR